MRVAAGRAPLTGEACEPKIEEWGAAGAPYTGPVVTFELATGRPLDQLYITAACLVGRAGRTPGPGVPR